MSTAFKGVVTNTYDKDWTDRKTGQEIVLKSFKIDSANQFFRTGTTEAVSDGDYISFTADNRGNVDLDSIAKEAGTPPKVAPKPKKASAGARDDYWTQKAERDINVTEPRISYSAAQKNATELVCVALEQDLLSFGNAAKGKKLDMIIDYVEQVTMRLAKLQIAAPEILKEVE
jgi:hypothetical protein